MTYGKRGAAYIGAALFLFLTEVLIAIFISTGFIRHTLGDVLATAFLYAVARIANIRPGLAAIVAFGVSLAVEVAQGFELLRRLGLQDNSIARIVLGATFSYYDIIAYAAGAFLAMTLDRRLILSMPGIRR